VADPSVCHETSAVPVCAFKVCAQSRLTQLSLSSSSLLFPHHFSSLLLLLHCPFFRLKLNILIFTMDFDKLFDEEFIKKAAASMNAAKEKRLQKDRDRPMPVSDYIPSLPLCFVY